MKRLLIVLLLLTIPFLQPISAFAQSITTVTTDNQTTATATTPEESLWAKFWNWISSVFIKTDYTITQRQPDEINSDMTEYGTTSDNNKHSSSGTRLTDSKSQICYKGNVIKKVILDKTGYPNTNLAQICNSPNGCVVSSGSESDCLTISIKDLAHYFVQTNQQFYCNDKNKLIDVENDIINAVNTNFTESISSTNLDCFQTIYQDFYLVPKDTDDQNEENSKNIVQTPISAGDQKSGSISDTKDQLNKNFVPANQNWDGLNSLRPAGW
ncbi:MAG: hypothetical protein PHN66_03360 [Candidatus Shapirobacteria bacterium]|nr:hypothetical protein [Candidatus Shapirobacteria bacterium]